MSPILTEPALGFTEPALGLLISGTLASVLATLTPIPPFVLVSAFNVVMLIRQKR